MSDTKDQTQEQAKPELKAENNAVAENEIVAQLHEASDGLFFPSETDAPLVPFFWPDENAVAPLTPERLCELVDMPADTPVKGRSIAAFFRPTTKAEDWHNAEESAEVARFQALVDTLKTNLKKPMAFRVGETQITAYVVGAVSDGWAGVQTKVVET